MGGLRILDAPGRWRAYLVVMFFTRPGSLLC
jgi:hypothetical protein